LITERIVFGPNGEGLGEGGEKEKLGIRLYRDEKERVSEGGGKNLGRPYRNLKRNSASQVRFIFLLGLNIGERKWLESKQEWGDQENGRIRR